MFITLANYALNAGSIDPGAAKRNITLKQYSTVMILDFLFTMLLLIKLGVIHQDSFLYGLTEFVNAVNNIVGGFFVSIIAVFTVAVYWLNKQGKDGLDLTKYDAKSAADFHAIMKARTISNIFAKVFFVCCELTVPFMMILVGWTFSAYFLAGVILLSATLSGILLGAVQDLFLQAEEQAKSTH